MNDWSLSYKGFEPKSEGRREVLCALGNGYIVSRAAAADAIADDVHYPGTYLAGGYNRLTTSIEDREIENEDLVNLPNWLPLTIRIKGDDWVGSNSVTYIDYHQELDLKGGVLSRTLRFRDAADRVTRWEEKRIVCMHDQHLAALSVTVTPENWSGEMTLRSMLDSSVTNWGVARYRALKGRHLVTLETGHEDGGFLTVRSQMIQARREIALAARTTVEVDGIPVTVSRTDPQTDLVSADYDLEAHEGHAIHVEKIVAYTNSKDVAISEPLLEAVKRVRHAGKFSDLLRGHQLAWSQLWDQCDIRIDDAPDGDAQLKLRLHIFHVLQTASLNSIDADVGMPPRGWHGEAYRGHIMWDDLFIFPFLNLRLPVVTRALLHYRYRRLDEARRAAREAGLKGAMFPWQSGSDGRDESQRLHLNPQSGRWIPDNTWRQRHINAAIAYNVWQYFEATNDREFLGNFGAELFFEIARLWSSLSERRADGRYEIKGVMGPDEFHTAYPGADPRTEGGVNNNAYTNVMVSWLLARALDVLDLIPSDDRDRLRQSLNLHDNELARWDEISRNLVIPIHADGVISQFEGYETLKEFDWERYRKSHDNLQRLDRILEAEGKDPNDYKVSKQADALMIFYLFSREEIEQIFDRLGYEFSPELIFKTIQYYVHRTSHGSTLSWLTHAWVLARADRQGSWDLALKALDSDYADIQGGTTPEGIHLGAMAGTLDLIQRCYTGIEMRAGVLMFNPRLPHEVQRMNATLRYRRQILDVEITQEHLIIASRVMTVHPVTISYRGHSREISPGQRFTFKLVTERKPDRVERKREQQRAGAERASGEGVETAA